MPRPREFDELEALAKATDLFWRRGYSATSVRDLGTELGLTPSSMYRTFVDKRSLFLRALDHYRATEGALTEERLRGTGPSRDVLRDTLMWIAGGTDHRDARGCLVVNTATELGTADPDIGRSTEAAFDVTRRALESALRRAVRDGELPADLDVGAAVELLFTVVLGLRVRERARHDPARLAAAIDTALRVLGPQVGARDSRRAPPPTGATSR